jgi:transcription antitermination factor NusB
MPIDESESAALERLRKEFVHKVSRSSPRSQLEEYLADSLTARLREGLGDYGPAMQAGLRDCLAQLFRTGEFWSRLDVEFMLGRQSFNALWAPPRTSAPVAAPAGFAALPASVLSDARLDAADRARLRDLLDWAREALPGAAVRAYAREIQIQRPLDVGLKTAQEYAAGRWNEFTAGMADRWVAAGQTTMRQTLDWLSVAGFTLRLVAGVELHKAQLDALLQCLEIGWAFDRQVSVDRNILRLAAFELTYMESIPASATINEAVELAKKYSTAESGRFVNGVLGAIAAQSRRDIDSGDSLDAMDDDGSEVNVDEIENEEELAHA